MIIAIPSFDRPHVLKTRTLSYLLQLCGVDPAIVHVFVVDSPEERQKYAFLRDMHVNVHYGPLGLHAMRNFIAASFPDGTHILSMDDDIKHLVYLSENDAVADKKSSKRYELQVLQDGEFLSWAESAFAALQMSRTKLFGIYPIKNGYFMKDLPYVTEDLRFCVGTCWGCINDSRIRSTIEEKEDVERTLAHFDMFGSVLRYNHIAAATSYYVTPGGMQSRGSDRRAASIASCQYLVATYPALCALGRVKKTTGIHEIRLLSRER